MHFIILEHPLRPGDKCCLDPPRGPRGCPCPDDPENTSPPGMNCHYYKRYTTGTVIEVNKEGGVIYVKMDGQPVCQIPPTSSRGPKLRECYCIGLDEIKPIRLLPENELEDLIL